jgi:hypothetical protein
MQAPRTLPVHIDENGPRPVIVGTDIKVAQIRGRLSDPRHIELDEPVNNPTGRVDVVVQEAAAPAATTMPRSFLGLCEDLGPAPSAEEIDEARREMWGGFPSDDI